MSRNTTYLVIACFNTFVLAYVLTLYLVRRLRKHASRTVEQQHAAYSQGCDDECGI